MQIRTLNPNLAKVTVEHKSQNRIILFAKLGEAHGLQNLLQE